MNNRWPSKLNFKPRLLYIKESLKYITCHTYVLKSQSYGDSVWSFGIPFPKKPSTCPLGLFCQRRGGGPLNAIVMLWRITMDLLLVNQGAWKPTLSEPSMHSQVTVYEAGVGFPDQMNVEITVQCIAILSILYVLTILVPSTNTLCNLIRIINFIIISILFPWENLMGVSKKIIGNQNLDFNLTTNGENKLKSHTSVDG